MGFILKIKSFTICIFILITYWANAQLITIETKLDTNSIEIGNRAELRYIVTKPSGESIKLPVFSDTLYDDIELTGLVKVDSVLLENNSKVRIEQILSITSYEPGMRYIPEQNFVYSGIYGTDTILSKAAFLMVLPVQVDSLGIIRDINPVATVRLTLEDILPFIIVILAIALIAYLAYRYWPSRKRANQELMSELQNEPPHIVALRELDRLKAQKLWQHNQLKDYYSLLTSIIRTYIEHQFGVLALEKTTNEILRDFNNTIASGKVNIQQLEELLNLADLVKFARGQALPEENIGHLESAYEFIKDSHRVYVENTVQNVNQAVEDRLRKSYSLSAKIKNAGTMSDFEIFHMLETNHRLVQYSYAISLIVITFKLNSKLYILPSTDNGKNKGIIFSIITIILGWWGIPWGPVRSIQALRTNFKGGKVIELR